MTCRKISKWFCTSYWYKWSPTRGFRSNVIKIWSSSRLGCFTAESLHKWLFFFFKSWSRMTEHWTHMFFTFRDPWTGVPPVLPTTRVQRWKWPFSCYQSNEKMKPPFQFHLKEAEGWNHHKENTPYYGSTDLFLCSSTSVQLYLQCWLHLRLSICGPLQPWA